MEKLPIGTGKEFSDKRREATLPALEVKNTVIWKNPAFNELPFNVELGKQSPLGIFFTPRPEVYPEERRHNPAIMPEWQIGRSGLLGSVIFKDRDGNVWRDVDVKGIGVFNKYVEVERSGKENFVEDPRKARGLMDYEFALRDKNYSEKLLKAGIRTHRVIAIDDLEEMIDIDGKKISIEEARARGIISEEMHPVIEERAFGTKERIDYLRPEDNPGLKRPAAALRDAMALVAQELGRDPKEFSAEDYLEWFAHTLGIQVAKLRKLKVHHGYLTGHNITLDCRIVDLDSMGPTKEYLSKEEWQTEESAYSGECADAKDTIFCLCEKINLIKTEKLDYEAIEDDRKKQLDKIQRIYMSSYEDELSSKKIGKKTREKTLKKAA